VQAVIYPSERIEFLFTRGADTFRVTLPTTDTIKTSIGSINLAGTNGVWTASVDNVGIRVADADAPVPATGVKVSSDYDMVASGGGTIPVRAAVLPWDASSSEMVWGVADPAIATVAVEAGNPSWVATLTGGNGGTAKVFATVKNASITDTLSIPVQAILVDSLYIQGSASVSVGHSINITKSNSEVWPANAGNKSVAWSVSKPGVVELAIASSGDTCTVTGINAGESEQDSVLIIATAADGGGAADTIKVYVSFTHATRIDLLGNRRVFYGNAADSIIALTPAFTPSTASDMEITGWKSTNTEILTVSDEGVATLTGAYGKAAVEVTAHDGGVRGYYYVEVAAENPYDEFTDFESPLRNDAALKLDTFAFVSNGFSASHTTFRNTGALYATASGVTGNRGMAAQLVDALTGERITLRFDFFAGKAGGSSATFAYGSISVKDNSAAPVSSGVNAGYGNSILSIAFIPDTVAGHNFFYYTGNDLFNAEYPSASDAERLPGTEETRAANAWGFLPELSTLDAWYTLEATIDNYLHTLSFTITELDAPERAHTVANVPFPSTFDPNVGAIYIFGRRISPSSLSVTSAVDNFGYKSIAELNHITVTLNPEGGAFSADGSTAAMALPAVANEPLTGLPQVSREGYTFAGWKYADGASYTEADVFAGDGALYAAWEILCYTVRYEGADLPDTCVNHNTLAVRPEPDPERECYEFAGWAYPDGSSWSYTTPITGDVTIVAQWDAIENCEGGGDEPTTSVASGVLSGVALYPNPASDVVTLTGLTGGETVDLISVSGSILLSRKAAGSTETIDVATLPSGIYYVQVAKGKARKTLKVTVQ
jgi:hypothetical protein